MRLKGGEFEGRVARRGCAHLEQGWIYRLPGDKVIGTNPLVNQFTRGFTHNPLVNCDFTGYSVVYKGICSIRLVSFSNRLVNITIYTVLQGGFVITL